jgi:hypothetical protein
VTVEPATEFFTLLRYGEDDRWYVLGVATDDALLVLAVMLGFGMAFESLKQQIWPAGLTPEWSRSRLPPVAKRFRERPAASSRLVNRTWTYMRGPNAHRDRT